MTLLSTRVDVRRVIGLRDQAGQPVTVTGHQFRHTLGTRLINSGVPQHVVQKLPGHASRRMIAHYARIHDSTIREAFDRYQRQRVNIAGAAIGYDPDARVPTSYRTSRADDNRKHDTSGLPGAS